MVVFFDRYNLPKDVFEVVFESNQDRIIAKLLFHQLKERGGQMTKTEMSLFANKLHEGELLAELNEPGYKGKTVKLTFDKRQLYDRILTPMKSLGMIDYDAFTKSYSLSDKLHRTLMEIGIMWLHELHANPFTKKRGLPKTSITNPTPHSI